MVENIEEQILDQETIEAIPEQQNERVVTVVLTADNHLGYAAFGQSSRKREERQQRLRRAFQQATDFAIAQGVDLFIQAGDLFDTTAPDERDRSFVAARLADLKQAGVHTFALGGVHDTPGTEQAGEETPAPQLSYARLGALHYFPPQSDTPELEPVHLDIHGVAVAICGVGVLAGQEGDPLKRLRVQPDIERAAIPILVLHAPIEDLAAGSALLDTRAQVSHSSIEKQSAFRYILAGYQHNYTHMRIGQTDVIVAGATQHVDFSMPDYAPGFVFLGLAADGLRWCTHVKVDAPVLQRLEIQVQELWPTSETNETPGSPTEIILERLRPLCDAAAMVQLRLVGALTRKKYHQLDLNQIRRYGEENSFALAIDDSALSLLPEQDEAEAGERLSPREELILLADEWIAIASGEQEKQALRITKEELLLAMDGITGKR
ncbi:MAG: metallophosphoesterase [Chloroflexota bacterium]|nr:metallophosphoesterase [Chloroflexota bacterium]